MTTYNLASSHGLAQLRADLSKIYVVLKAHYHEPTTPCFGPVGDATCGLNTIFFKLFGEFHPRFDAYTISEDEFLP